MFDTEKLIREIEKRPALYNVRDKDYSNREVKTKLWEEIGAQMFNKWYDFTTDDKSKLGLELRTKWKSIRDHFRKEFLLEKKVKAGKANGRKKKYVYYDQLQFLKEYFEKNPVPPSNSNEKGGDTSQPKSQDVVQADNSASVISDNISIRTEKREQTRSKRQYPENSDIEEIRNILLERHERNQDKMGNKAFLMSLLPLLDGMSRDDAIHFRYKIMEMFYKHNITYSNESNFQIDSQNSCTVAVSNSNLSPRPDSPKFNPIRTPSPRPDSPKFSPIRTPSPASSENSQMSEASTIFDLY